MKTQIMNIVNNYMFKMILAVLQLALTFSLSLKGRSNILKIVLIVKKKCSLLFYNDRFINIVVLKICRIILKNFSILKIFKMWITLTITYIIKYYYIYLILPVLSPYLLSNIWVIEMYDCEKLLTLFDNELQPIQSIIPLFTLSPLKGRKASTTNFKYYLIRLFKIIISTTIAYVFRTNIHTGTYLIPLYSLSMLNITLPSDIKALSKAELEDSSDVLAKKSCENKVGGGIEYK